LIDGIVFHFDFRVKEVKEADVNDDNTVDMGDLFAVTKSGHWGDTCP